MMSTSTNHHTDTNSTTTKTIMSQQTQPSSNHESTCTTTILFSKNVVKDLELKYRIPPTSIGVKRIRPSNKAVLKELRRQSRSRKKKRKNQNNNSDINGDDGNGKGGENGDGNNCNNNGSKKKNRKRKKQGGEIEDHETICTNQSENGNSRNSNESLIIAEAVRVVCDDKTQSKLQSMELSNLVPTATNKIKPSDTQVQEQDGKQEKHPIITQLNDDNQKYTSNCTNKSKSSNNNDMYYDISDIDQDENHEEGKSNDDDDDSKSNINSNNHQPYNYSYTN